MQIIGAGMAGLLAAQMLRRHSPTVFEAQPTLPNNHAALLRFRTTAVADATTIPFRQVMVRKGLVDRNGMYRTMSTIPDSNAYSLKVTGEVMDRSMLNLEPATRYIAPDDFIAQLAKGVAIEYNWALDGDGIGRYPGMISTIPMPVLMKLVGWDRVPEFQWRPIWTVAADFMTPRTMTYETLYFSSLALPYYRASITGRHLTIEYMKDPDDRVPDDINDVLKHFGYDFKSAILTNLQVKRQEYGKLLPIPEQDRRQFILAMSDKYGIYSVGRFATWRQILLDDVVKDIRIVERYIMERDDYQRRLNTRM